MEKTNLSKILSISGQHGLFRFIAQSRGGAIVESLEDGRRTAFGSSARISSLADISIYTDDGEVKLKEVLTKLHEVLSDSDAPDQKSGDDAFKGLFSKAVPNYDADRFYVSHMKKIALWYNLLKNHASLDFEEAETPSEGEEGEKGEE